MFASILCLVAILALAFKFDYRMLVSDGSMRQSFLYGALFAIGFIMTAIYVVDPALPNLFGAIGRAINLVLRGGRL